MYTYLTITSLTRESVTDETWLMQRHPREALLPALMSARREVTVLPLSFTCMFYKVMAVKD